MPNMYRVGDDYYLDSGLLRAIASVITVEPMAGGYQILARAGLIRCNPVQQTLPGQEGDLFRLSGAYVSGLTTKIRPNEEWETWPSPTAPSGAQACGTSCGAACACGPCSARHDHSGDEHAEHDHE